MARNKYPEVTVEKILEVAKRLFLEKGYEHTTIQDIVNELGGLTKGAIYHHFKSKEELMDALGDKLFLENNPFTAIKQRNDLNGLQKMREVIKLNHADADRAEVSAQSLSLLKNTRILASMIDSDRRLIAPLWLELIEEGTRDGSIQTPYAKEFSEIIPLLTNLWLAPTVYPATTDEIIQKFSFIKDMLDNMGLPLIDDEITDLAIRIFRKMGEHR